MTTLPTLCITGKLELKVCAVSQVSVKGLKVELLYLASYSLVLFDRSRYHFTILAQWVQQRIKKLHKGQR